MLSIDDPILYILNTETKEIADKWIFHLLIYIRGNTMTL